MNSTGCSHVCSLFVNEEYKVFDTFVTYAGLAYVTDADCWAQNGRSHGRCFQDFQTSIFYFEDQKSSKILLCEYLFYSVSIDRACDYATVPFAFNTSDL